MIKIHSASFLLVRIPPGKKCHTIKNKKISQYPNFPKWNQRTQILNSSKQENSSFFNRKIKINRKNKRERERERRKLTFLMILLSLLDFQNPPQNNKHRDFVFLCFKVIFFSTTINTPLQISLSLSLSLSTHHTKTQKGLKL